jgi:hypothetical protein
MILPISGEIKSAYEEGTVFCPLNNSHIHGIDIVA